MVTFQPGDVVLHRKTGRHYRIVIGADVCRLEEGALPAYAYRLASFDPAAATTGQSQSDVDSQGNDGRVWVRVASEMEDGRFVLAPPTQ